MIGLKAVDSRVKAGGAPGDLALINTYVLEPLKAPDVAVYTLRVANDQIDRDGERFNVEVLHDFAATLPGKALLEGHAWGPVGIGRFFKAWVEQVDGVTWLMAKCYLLTADEVAAQMIVKLNGGIASFVSIGFSAPRRIDVRGMAGETVGEYRRGPNGEQAEAIEASLVFLGAQYDAAVVKGMAARLRRAQEEPHMKKTQHDPSARERIRTVASKETALRRELARIEKRLAGQSGDSPDRRRRNEIRTELTAIRKGLDRSLVSFGEDYAAALRAEDIERLSRPSIAERLLSGTEHATKARERRLRRLDEAKASGGSPADAASVKAAISGKPDQRLDGALAERADDSLQVFMLQERLRNTLSIAETLAARVDNPSPLVPAGQLDRALQLETERAAHLIGRIEQSRSAGR